MKKKDVLLALSKPVPQNRTFDTGANRNGELGKLDFEGFLDPMVLNEYAKYMNKHRELEDGTIRDSDNWKKLFGDDHYSVCMKSALRHVHDMWMEHRGYPSREGIEDAMMGALFNINAYAFKYYTEKHEYENDKR